MSEAKQKNTLVHDALILFAITVIAAIALGFVYEVTKDPIAAAEEKARIEAFQAVFPEMASTSEWSGSLEEAQALIDADPELEATEIRGIVNALDSSGNVIGKILTIANTKGYGGEIEAVMGIASDGTLKGVEFLTLKETAGLGMKADTEEFKAQFRDAAVKRYSLTKRKISGDTEIDAISSATITTTAVTRIVDAGLKIFEQMGGID